MNPSSSHMAGNLGLLSAQKMTFGFRVTFQNTMTKSSTERSPGPATPNPKLYPILCFGLIYDTSRWQCPLLE